MYVDSGATALKGATIKSYKVECGGKSITTATGYMNYVESGDFVFTVVDSRGYTTTKTVKKTLINYIRPTCNIKTSTPDTSGKINLTISGNYYNGSFGAKNNTLTLKYRKKQNGGSYGSWVNVSPTITNNTYSITVEVSGLDYQSSYTFQANIKDETTEIYSAEITIKTTPVFDWGKNDFNFNVSVSGADRFISNKSETGFRHIHGSSGNSISFGVGATGVNRGIYDDTQAKWLLLNNGTDVLIDGYPIGKNNILLAGAYYMNEAQTQTFIGGQKVSQQENGIVLIFSAYSDGKAQDYSFNTFFVPKYAISTFSGKGFNFVMSASKFGYVATKYIYITDTTVKGNADNTASGTANGITYNNSAFVLRYVIGV
jgi:hypothetical protein